MSVDVSDLICGSCEWRRIDYDSKAEDYGFNGFSNRCVRREYGVERCPKAADWRRYFQENKDDDDEAN